MKLKNSSFKIELTETEREALKVSSDVMVALIQKLPGNIMSIDTGECVEISELLRVNGILQGILEDIRWVKDGE